MLHNGLVLDGLDEHDAEAVVAGLCVDPLLQILAPRCAHVPEQRQELLETCTTRRAQPRPI